LIEQNLDADVHIPLSRSNVAEAGLAMLPVLEPVVVSVKARVEALVEACPVAPVGEGCAVIASGEGCEIVVPVAGAESGQPQVA
jgi:hypothetical protein